MTQLALYETARAALIEALRVDEVLAVKDQAERIRLYGRQARDRRIIADATELQMRAERKLGVLLKSAHETGQIGYGRRSNMSEESKRLTLQEIGVDKKLSAHSQRLASLDEDRFDEAVQQARSKCLFGKTLPRLRDVTPAKEDAQFVGRCDLKRTAVGHLPALIQRLRAEAVALERLYGFGAPISTAQAVSDAVPKHVIDEILRELEAAS